MDKSKNILKIVNILKAVYPERWTINKIPDSTSYYVYILWDDITITNSNNDTHNIKDLYMRFTLSEDLKISTIKGFRGTLSPVEWVYGYQHSHLGGNNAKKSCYDEKFSGFCLGGGTEVPSLMAEIDIAERFDENLYILFLYSLDAYVKWESVEGGPYRHMKNINYSTSLTSIPYDGHSSYNNWVRKLIDYYREESENLPVKYNNVSKKFEINYLDLEYNPLLIDACSNFTVLKKGTGVYVNDDDVDLSGILRMCKAENNRSLEAPSLFTFKNKPINRTIDIAPLLDIKDDTVGERVLDPALSKKIATFLGTTLNNIQTLNYHNLMDAVDDKYILTI